MGRLLLVAGALDDDLVAGVGQAVQGAAAGYRVVEEAEVPMESGLQATGCIRFHQILNSKVMPVSGPCRGD